MSNWETRGFDTAITEHETTFSFNFVGDVGSEAEVPETDAGMSDDDVRKEITAVHAHILERVREDLERLATLKRLEWAHRTRRLTAKAAAGDAGPTSLPNDASYKTDQATGSWQETPRKN